MRKLLPTFIMFATVASADIVSSVRLDLAKHDFNRAEQEVAAYREQNGATPETIEALSWLGRGALEQKRLDDAERYSSETQRLVLEQLRTRKLDADRHLPPALGAAIEVHAAVLTDRGRRSEAVSYLNREIKAYWDTSIRARIQKNLNLLTLEGKPAPALDVRNWLGPRPMTLPALRGRPVLLFFWAHWCPDCKDEIPVLAGIERRFGPRGLVLVGPTQHYGYVARGEEAPPEQETQYIDRVRRTMYAPLSAMTVPLSEENFKVYGASTVPTLVLVDQNGVVRMYHPDVMPYAELEEAVEKILPR